MFNSKLRTFGKGLLYTLAGLALLLIEASIALLIGKVFIELKDGGDIFVWAAMIASLGSAYFVGTLFGKLWNKGMYEFAWLYRAVDRVETYIQKVGESKVFVAEAIVILIALVVIVRFYPRTHNEIPVPQSSAESRDIPFPAQRIEAPIIETSTDVKIYGLGFVCSHQYSGLCESVTYKSNPKSTPVAVRASEFSEGALFTGNFTSSENHAAFVTNQDQILILDENGKLVSKIDINTEEGEILELYELNVVDPENFSVGYMLTSGRNFMIVCQESTLTINLYLRMQ